MFELSRMRRPQPCVCAPEKLGSLYADSVAYGSGALGLGYERLV